MQLPRRCPLQVGSATRADERFETARLNAEHLADTSTTHLPEISNVRQPSLALSYSLSRRYPRISTRHALACSTAMMNLFQFNTGPTAQLPDDSNYFAETEPRSAIRVSNSFRYAALLHDANRLELR